MTHAQQHFEALYRAKTDPWGVADRWYEQRKRALLLAALPRGRYRNAFEPGCGNGEMTAELAGRCEHLDACDFSATAAAIAARRTAQSPQVHVHTLALPGQWPGASRARYDLIVISELAYYLDDGQLEQLIARCTESLAPHGDLAACHSLRAFDDRRQDTRSIHGTFDIHPALRGLVRHEEDDFLLQVWRKGAPAAIKDER